MGCVVGLLTALASLCGVLVAGPVSVAEGRGDERTGGPAAPRFGLPGAAGPVLANAPHANAPHSTVPHPVVPHVTVPRHDAHHATLPQRTTPPATWPRHDAPRTTAPRRKAPRTTTPRPAVPHAKAPARATTARPGGARPAAVPAARRPAKAQDAGAGGRAGGRNIFRGWAFDRCQAPSVGTMRKWLASPYRGVGVYFGGHGRHCKRQKHLSRAWLREVTGLGWRVIPVYVGSQSPCVIAKSKRHYRIGGNAWAQGRQEGRDAVASARRLGMARGSALYLDMEAYHHRRYRCARTTLAFVRSWNREVRRQGYLPGYYSSANSGVRHMEQARRAGERDMPEVMWFARWGVPPSLYGEKWLHRRAWHPHRRIHQYAGDVTERHGGRKLAIDRNRVDAPVAVIR